MQFRWIQKCVLTVLRICHTRMSRSYALLRNVHYKRLSLSMCDRKFHIQIVSHWSYGIDGVSDLSLSYDTRNSCAFDGFLHVRRARIVWHNFRRIVMQYTWTPTPNGIAYCDDKIYEHSPAIYRILHTWNDNIYRVECNCQSFKCMRRRSVYGSMLHLCGFLSETYLRDFDWSSFLSPFFTFFRDETRTGAVGS